MGLEDLETLERMFSASNQLASITRYASPYRRRLFIEAYFRQWDDDKNLVLGAFIFNNIKQALEIIKHDTKALENGLRSMSITEAELDEWEQEQAAFFGTLGEEEPYDAWEIAYVELL